MGVARARERFLVWAAGWMVAFLTEAAQVCRKITGSYLDTVHVHHLWNIQRSCLGAAGELALGAEKALDHQKALEATQERRSTERRRHGLETEPEEGQHSKGRREHKN